MSERNLATPSEPNKYFEVYILCEDDAVQGKNYAGEILKHLRTVTLQVGAARFSGPLHDDNGTTVGLWKTHWRNDDPEDRKPPRRGRQPLDFS
jgi:hypothetical protein